MSLSTRQMPFLSASQQRQNIVTLIDTALPVDVLWRQPCRYRK